MGTVDIDPVAFSIGSLKIYWYGVLFALSIVIAWTFINIFVKKTSELGYSTITLNQLDKFMLGAIVVTVISARIGHVLFFELDYYLHNPLEIVMLRNGGLSFHGGLIGMIIYTWIYCSKHSIPKLFLADTLCFATSGALITGRLANFVNQELVGKVWASEFGVVFKAVDDLPRYPTQLYEAMTEGLLTFMILSLTLKLKGWKSVGTGIYTSLFCIVYSSSRFIIEFFKDTDIACMSLTVGQILCLFMFCLGLIFHSHHTKHV